MTDDRSLERAARTWLEAGPTQAPDRAVDAALLRIDATTQERDLRVPWRLPSTITNRLALVVAAIVVLVAGAFAFTRVASVGQTSPTTAPSIAPSSAPSPTPINAAACCTDLPGWIVFEHFGNAPDGSNPGKFNVDNHMIWMVHADGSGLHELAPGNPTVGKISPDISPDGTKVAFASSSDHSAIYEVPIEGGAPQELPACAGVTTCAAADPTYSADGNRVAFVKLDFAATPPSMAIAILDLASSKVTTLERTRISLDLGDVSQPSWSPDGTQVVYAREWQTQTQDEITGSRLFVAKVDGSGLTELPEPPDIAPAPWEADPDWSPDGSTIVFGTLPNRGIGWAPPHLTFILTVRPDGSYPHMVCLACVGGGGVDPTWTPDGKHIMYFTSTDHSWALMNPDGSDAAHINRAKLTWWSDVVGYGAFAVLQPTP